jgi:hypothetical protein
LGIDNLPWLADPSLAKFAIIFIAVWSGTGWHATLYLAYLQAIPKDLYEQATIDGAGPFQRFFLTRSQKVDRATRPTRLHSRSSSAVSHRATTGLVQR